MKKTFKKLLSILLALCMLITFAPMTFALKTDFSEETEYINRLYDYEHSFNSGEVVDYAIYPCEPIVKFTCTDCGFTHTVNFIVDEDHDLQWTVGYPATCINYGLTDQYACEACGLVLIGHEWIEPTGIHTPDEGDYSESYCEPSCRNAGYYIKENACSVCGEYFVTVEEYYEPLGHLYSSTVIAPSCTDSGYTLYECSRCGDDYTSDVTEASGHNYVDLECTECGDVKYIIEAMSSQIRFNKYDDGTYAGTFDIRSRAMISDEDFTAIIGTTNEEASMNIKNVGFVYSVNVDSFSTEDALTVAKGGEVTGYVDAPVKYIQDADGYYMFTCLVTGIPSTETERTLVSYAYICVEIDGVETWYFMNTQTETDFASLYSTYYPAVAEKYGW